MGGRQYVAIDYQLLNANTAPLRSAVPNIATLTATRSHTLRRAVPGVTDVSFIVGPLAEGQKETFFHLESSQYTFNRLPRGINIHSQLLIPCLLNFHRQSHSLRM